MIGFSDGTITKTYEDNIDYLRGIEVPTGENNAPAGSVGAPRGILQADLDKRTPPPLPMIPPIEQRMTPLQSDSPIWRKDILPPTTPDQWGKKLGENVPLVPNQGPEPIQPLDLKGVPKIRKAPSIVPKGDEPGGGGFVPGSGARIGQINNMYNVPTGSISGKESGTVYVDHKIPAEFHPFLAVHETTEAGAMKEGKSYDEAHDIATKAEAQAVMQSGKWKSWDEYTDAVDPYVALAEKDKGTNLPPETPHVPYATAEGHHQSSAKQLEGADKTIVSDADERPIAGQQYAMEDTQRRTQFSVPGVEMQGPGRGGVGGGYSQGGNVTRFVRGANINEPTEGGPSKSPHRPGRSISDLSPEERQKLAADIENSQVPYNPPTPAHEYLLDKGLKPDVVSKLTPDQAKYVQAFAQQKIQQKGSSSLKTVGEDFKPTKDQLAGQSFDKLGRQMEEFHTKTVKEMDSTLAKLKAEFPDLPPLPEYSKMSTAEKLAMGGSFAALLGASGFGGLMAYKGMLDKDKNYPVTEEGWEEFKRDLFK